MINTGSYHVYPQEVQDAITALPYIRAARIRGEDDPVWGQAVTAYVVAAPGAPAELDQAIREALRQRLASYKIPKRVILVPSLEDITPRP
jgi:acyl-CoA synthetase (AMP-forming)/AMP-acid ligase II